MNNNIEIKREILRRLYNRNVFIKQVNDEQYVTRCPECGDTQKSLNKGHFYMKISLTDNSPIAYDCKKCPAHGYLNYNILQDLLGYDDLLLKSDIDTLIKTSDKVDQATKFQRIIDKRKIHYDYKLPKLKYNDKIKYIENRIGVKLHTEDCIKMKVITSLRDFVKLNNIKTIPVKKGMARMLDKNYVGFLTNSGSYILFRDVTDTMPDDLRWFKYKIDKDRLAGTAFYTVESTLDIFTKDKIIINITEGVMDILSVIYNCGFRNTDNCINIAMTGKCFRAVLDYFISLGIAGSNVVVNLWSDADHRYDKKKYDTTLEYYQKHLFKYKYIFGEFNVYYNLKSKDFGVPLEDIMIQKHKL